MQRRELTDASEAMQKAFGLCYRSGAGQPVLEWIIAELYEPLYDLGQPTELAVAQCSRQQFAELIKDMIRRGLSALGAEAKAQGDRPEQEELER